MWLHFLSEILEVLEKGSGALFSAWASWWAVHSIKGLRFYFKGGCLHRVCPTAWNATFSNWLLPLGKLNGEMWEPSVPGCERLLSLLYPVSVKQCSFCKYSEKLCTLINVFLICNTVWLWLYFQFCHRNWLGVSFEVTGCYELSYNLLVPALGQGELFQFGATGNYETGFVLL